MGRIEPGDPSYDDALERIATIIRQSEQDLDRISELSEQSFREWIDAVVQKTAAVLGIALAHARAVVADFIAIAANARAAFKTSYREAYAKARRVERRS